ncbi:MAG: hypothetical protein EXR65_00535 [Dehalococcoidia bacterium]|nr:hypothetical protein [Dehalococcoidia bacterium]
MTAPGGAAGEPREPRRREGAQLRVLPLAGLHLQLGCRPTPAHGWSMPLWYEGALDEQEQTRRAAGVFDRSHLGRFYVTGERAGAVLGRVLASDPARMAVGAVQRAVACQDGGTILDLVTLGRLDDQRWLVVTGPRHGDRLLAAVAAEAAGAAVEVHDRRMATALVSLQGPAAAEIFGKVFGASLRDGIARERCRELLLGLHRAAILRTSAMGEDGFWLLIRPDDGAELWRAFVAAGAVSAGLQAHDALRLEAAVLEAPAETPPPVTPQAAGLGSLVELDGRAFRGAEALRAAGPPPRLLTGLWLEGPRLARAGARISIEGADVGACVAGGYSPALGAAIALAYLPPGAQRVEVDAGGQHAAATVVPLPFVALR